MKYTDKELKEATQIAYLTFLEKAEDNLMADGKKGPYTIKELITSCMNTEEAKIAALKEGVDKNKITLQDLVKYSDFGDFDKSIIEEFSDDILDWKIVDIHNMNPENGFYGCVIETTENKAIVAFRGSENMKSYSGLKNDWIKADLCLLNSRCTEQQEEAEKYADALIYNGILDKYDSLAVTGHSLGGNLATHFTISCAEDKRNSIFKKIDQSVNLDGPGFSDEYIRNHWKKINKASEKLTHYKWSAVGSLLYNIPGEKVEFMAINENLHNKNLIDRIKYKVITRHSTKSLVFDKEGRINRGKQDIVAKGASIISKAAEIMVPTSLTSEALAVTDWLFDKILYEKEDGSIGLKNPVISEKISKDESVDQNRKVQIKCGNLINGMIGVFKDGALRLEKKVKSELNGFLSNVNDKKEALYDVNQAIDNNNRYNANSVNNATKILNRENKINNMEYGMR